MSLVIIVAVLRTLRDEIARILGDQVLTLNPDSRGNLSYALLMLDAAIVAVTDAGDPSSGCPGVSTASSSTEPRGPRSSPKSSPFVNRPAPYARPKAGFP